MQQSKNDKRLHRKKRIRAKVSGTHDVPRMAIFRSITDMTVQLIDDTTGTTRVSASLRTLKAPNTVGGAQKLGAEIAQKAKDAKITAITFDRSGYQYHGRIKALADAAREGGLTF